MSDMKYEIPMRSLKTEKDGDFKEGRANERNAVTDWLAELASGVEDESVVEVIEALREGILDEKHLK